MTTLSGGTSLTSQPYIGVCQASRTKKLMEDENRAVSVLQCEKTETSTTSNGSAGQSNDSSAPVLDIVINNVVCSFNLRCHLNLKHIALNGCNVEYRRENGMVTMKLRNPSTTASIWSSGKITCTGATSDADARKASRRFARMIQQLGFKVKFTNFRIVNVLGTCTMPFAIRISQFSALHRQHASYEPELHPGVTFKIKELKATLKIFSTGNITITAPSIRNVQSAVEHIFPLVYEFRKERLQQFKPRCNTNTSDQTTNFITGLEQDEDEEEEDLKCDENSEAYIHDGGPSWD